MNNFTGLKAGMWLLFVSAALVICLQPVSCDDDDSHIGIDIGPGWSVSYRDAEPAWSPDGKKILYRKWHAEDDSTPIGTYLYEVATGKSVNLNYPMQIESPCWSPDGRWIAFHWNYQVFAMKLNGDSLRQLTYTDDHNIFCRWSPCGSGIAYTQMDGVDRGLWLVDFTTGSRKLLSLFGVGPPDWLSDCAGLVFISYKFGDFAQIAMIDTLGSKDSSVTREVQLTNTSQCVKRACAASSAGDKIAFVQQCGNEPSNLWIVNRDGSNLKRLTTKGGEFPDWSPDGQWILYTNSEEGNGRLWIMRPDGSERRQLTFSRTTNYN
jgi:Tol biopolymer transport system component